jgi:tetratricopeptide (TPR) repeat protein
MQMLRAALIALWLAAPVVQAAESPHATVFGVSEALAEGSRALQFGDYELGVRLTLEGLRDENRRLNRARALSNLCAGYTGLGDHQRALAACDEALSFHRGNWRIYNNRALALAGLGRFHEARADLDAALALRPEAPTLARTRAWIDARAPRAMVADAAADRPLTQ